MTIKNCDLLLNFSGDVIKLKSKGNEVYCNIIGNPHSKLPLRLFFKYRNHCKFTNPINIHWNNKSLVSLKNGRFYQIKFFRLIKFLLNAFLKI
ncbi:hypothetical protein DCC35_05340 [Mangrovivirga cuniculi]|uniref:Uncharacterized protein n=1 Tax=Mangrovivirga cuniculi TaxID=2715131 RepID=A0A4D7K451_9BACT|nr:hypothetical protein DCC35_05340 [Mangrovivirga cuniculi]